MALDKKETILAATAAVLAWAALFLLTLQAAYSWDLYWLMAQDFLALVIAMTGLAITLLAIAGKSEVPHDDKIVIGTVSMIVFYGCTFAGSLVVACANGNCL